MMITQNLLTKGSKQGRTGEPLTPVGVVIHWVGNPGSTALANRNYFENGSGGNGVSAHYVVGLKGEIIQCIPENERAQHAGKSYGTKWNDTAKFNNIKYIGIENCHPDSGGKFNDITYKSLVWLTAKICKRHKLNPLKEVFRHYDVSGKGCPLFYVNNSTAWDKLIGDINEAVKKNVTSSVQPNREANLKTLVDAGVINSPDYWRGVNNVEYLDVLLANAAKSGVLDRRVMNGVKDINIALKILVDAGIINSPDYWLNLVKAGTVKYLSDLLIKIADKSRNVLERILTAEAADEDEKGIILVANVIFNRVKSLNFPNSVYDVVFQDKQFEPTRSGAYDRAKPTNKVKAALDKAFSVDYSIGALYFRAIKGATADCWHETALVKLFDYGCHRFYR